MGLVARLQKKFSSARPVKEWQEYSLEEKTTLTARSGTMMVLRGYTYTDPIFRLTERGTKAIEDYVVNPMERKELEEILNVMSPQREFGEIEYYAQFNEVAFSPLSDSLPFYQRLCASLDNISRTLDQEKLYLLDFHFLLSTYILEQAESQELISRSGLTIAKRYGHQL